MQLLQRGGEALRVGVVVATVMAGDVSNLDRRIDKTRAVADPIHHRQALAWCWWARSVEASLRGQPIHVTRQPRSPTYAPRHCGRLAQGSLRVIQQIGQLVEQLKFPLPDGTQLGVQVPRARCPLALALHV